MGQVIRCPKCDSVQKATINQSIPWWVYIHHCNYCKYIIMESEWDVISDDELGRYVDILI